MTGSNTIKNISAALLVCVLVLCAVVQFAIGAVKADDTTATEESTPVAAATEQDDTTEYIYFDLAAGKITINGTTYTGYVYSTESGATTTKTVTGTASANNKYYIYQSTEANKSTTGLVDGKMVLPQYGAMMYGDTAWSEYITNNSSVEDVITNWNSCISGTGRTSTTKKIEISGGQNVDVVFDNLWSTWASTGNSDGPVKVSGLGSKANVTIRLKGDSRFRNIYYNNNSNNGSKLVIDSAEVEDKTSGSMTVAALGTNMTRNNNTDWPDCLAVIGAANSAEYGLTFNGGTVFAGFPAQNNRVWNDRDSVAFATCVGGGNNKPGEVTINGGCLTAVSNGTTTAIGAGGGYNLTGGEGTVNISGGEVYAYAWGIYSVQNDRTGYVPTTAIGGASTFIKKADTGNVTITGGKVYAVSLGGTAIGGGNSKNNIGGEAVVSISNNAEVTALSKSGSVCSSLTDSTSTYYVESSNAIGGGMGTTGGAATVAITGGTTTCTAIGGGTGSTGNGGNADVYITSGELHTGTVGGGTSTNGGAIGYARAYISGGDIQGQFLLRGDDDTGRCEFVMTDGTIHDVSTQNPAYAGLRKENGGAVWMDDTQGVVTISGGTISGCSAVNGGAVYMTGGTFTLTGEGKIENCKATGEEGNDASGLGGAVYLGGGRAVVGVDRVLSNTTTKTITSTTTDENGKETTIEETYTVGTNAIVSYLGLEENTGTDAATKPLKTVSITFTNDKTDTSNPYVGNIACAITDCSARYGGALYVSGNIDDSTDYKEETSTPNTSIDPSQYSVYVSAGTISGNTAAQNGGGLCVNNGHVLMDGGSLDANTATAGYGGAMYLSSKAKNDARVRVRTGSVCNNVAGKGGGAIAVSGLEDSQVTLKVTLGVNIQHEEGDVISEGEAGSQGEPAAAALEEGETSAAAYITNVCDHINDGTDTTCPVVKNNTVSSATEGSGGAIYITGGENTILNIYCISESGNSASADTDTGITQSDFLMVKGGKVIITTGSKQSNEKATDGYCLIQGSIHIVGGSLDIYGNMTNPQIDAVITVELEDATDHFEDHRVRYKDDPQVYWVHYYENFPEVQDDGSTVYTGRFKALEVNAASDYAHTIRASLFERAGYVIQGWYTTQDGQDSATQTTNQYLPGTTFTFPNVLTHDVLDAGEGTGTYASDLIANTDRADGEGEGELTTLVLYAVWVEGNYTVHFDANVDEYSGAMDNQAFAINKAQALSANAFVVPGMKFAGWATSPDGEVAYGDREPVTNLTSEIGGMVTLYAKWVACDHPQDNRVFLADGAQIYQTCGVCGMELGSATVSGVSVYYDGAEHPATVTYSTDWEGERSLAISYEMAESDWDSKDDVDDNWTSSSVPVHAGKYTASISASVGSASVKASCTYEIYRIKWETPERPKVKVTFGEGSTNRIEIVSPIDNSGLLKYAVSEDKEPDGATTWSTEKVYDVDKSHNRYYYFSAKKFEDRDHETSDASSSLAYLTTNGITVVFDVEIGIDYSITTEPGENSGKLEFETHAASGYHLRNYEANESSDKAKESFSLSTDGNNSGYKHVLGGLSDTDATGAVVTITITGVAKDASVTAKSIEKQVFVDFNGTNPNTAISRDSAFTAAFTVNDYLADEYSVQELVFGQALPAGTTIIMKADGAYYYYNVDSAEKSASSTSISLAYFCAMGSTTKYFEPAVNKSGLPVYSATSTTLKYQFVVDFSDVSGGIAGDALNVDLELSPASWHGNTAPAIPATNVTEEATSVEHQLSISLASPASFALSASPSQNTTDTATLTCVYTAPGAAASIWDGRASAIVLSVADGSAALPADAYLEVDVSPVASVLQSASEDADESQADGATAAASQGATRHLTVHRNTAGQFIVELGDLGEYALYVLDVQLCSNLLPKQAAAYKFAADWYVSASAADASPLNGLKTASCNVDFSAGGNTSPSLKITGASRLFSIGDNMAVSVATKNIPDGAYIKSDILRYSNTSGGYVSTGAGNKVANGGGAQTVSLAGYYVDAPSRYCLMYTIYNAQGEALLEVPYYFILKP